MYAIFTASTSDSTSNLAQVLDDAIKIGFPSILTLISIWLTARLTRRQQLDKIRFERRSEALEQVSAQVDETFQMFLSFHAKLGGIRLLEEEHIPGSIEAEVSFEEMKRKKYFEIIELGRVTSFSLLKCASARSKLQLWGETKCIESLSSLVSAMSDAMLDLNITPVSFEGEKLRTGANIARAYRHKFDDEMRKANQNNC